jgi:hypothetical protein
MFESGCLCGLLPAMDDGGRDVAGDDIVSFSFSFSISLSLFYIDLSISISSTVFVDEVKSVEKLACKDESDTPKTFATRQGRK